MIKAIAALILSLGVALLGLVFVTMMPADVPAYDRDTTAQAGAARAAKPVVAPVPQPAPTPAPVTAQSADPVPTPEPVAAPEPVPARFTAAGIEAMRAAALQTRAQAAADVLAQAAATHQRRVDWALRSDSDTLFHADVVEQAKSARLACIAGGASDCAALADLYADGTGTLMDGPLAFSLRMQACEAGSDAACLALSKHPSFEGSEPVATPHIDHFEARCAQGWAIACENLALYAKYGFHQGVDKDEALSEALYAKACALGSGAACVATGDKDQAGVLYQTACDAGDAAACVRAGRLLRSSDLGAAIRLMERACDAAPYQHCADLGRILSDTAPAKSQAAYIKGCEAGNLRLCGAVAKQLTEADGDPTQVRAFYAKACADPHAELEVCRTMRGGLLAGLDAWDPEVAALLGHTDDVSELTTSCAAGAAEGCLSLAQSYGQIGTGHAAYVTRALTAQACAHGSDTACNTEVTTFYTSDNIPTLRARCDAGLDAACAQLIIMDHDAGATRESDLSALCATGNVFACGYIGEMFINGGDRFARVDVDVAAGIPLLQQGCDGGAGQSCISLARLHDPDITHDDWAGVSKDIAVALALYEKGCALGVAHACNIRSHRGLQNGDLDLALTFAIKACASGDCASVARSQLFVDRRALDAEHGVFAAAMMDRPQDFTPAMQGAGQRARTGCLADIPQACIDFGVHIYQSYAGGGAPAVAHEAADRLWAQAAYLRACDLGDARGCAMYAESHDGIGEDSEPLVSLAYHKTACDMGRGLSCAQAGFYSELGSDVPEDEGEAAAWYAKGCTAGAPYACQNLGGLYDIADTDPAQFITNQLLACVHGKNWTCGYVADDFASGHYDLPKSPEIAAILNRIGCEDDEDCVSP